MFLVNRRIPAYSPSVPPPYRPAEAPVQGWTPAAPPADYVLGHAARARRRVRAEHPGLPH
ncbi:hypothetical protein [Streptomyces sp. NPDC054794]